MATSSYGTAEGVLDGIPPDQVVMARTRPRPEQDPRCRAKDQSIHIFSIPAPAALEPQDQASDVPADRGSSAG